LSFFYLVFLRISFCTKTTMPPKLSTRAGVNGNPISKRAKVKAAKAARAYQKQLESDRKDAEKLRAELEQEVQEALDR
jgi:hypothetical protein